MDTKKIRARSSSGMVLAEILVAMVVAGFLVGALFQGVLSLQGGIYRWDRSMRMRQALMVAMFRLCADLRMAGCNPWGKTGFDAVEPHDGFSERVSAFTIRMDKRGGAIGSGPDGDAGDPDERIEYRWDEGERVLRRNGQPLLLDVYDNPWGRAFFELEEDAGYGLARIVVSVRERGESRSLSSIVCIRNPL